MIEVSFNDVIFDEYSNNTHMFRMESRTFTPSKFATVDIPKHARILKVGLMPTPIQNNEGVQMMQMAVTFIYNHCQEETTPVRLTCLKIDEPVALREGETAKLLGQVPVNNQGDSFLVWQIS